MPAQYFDLDKYKVIVIASSVCNNYSIVKILMYFQYNRMDGAKMEHCGWYSKIKLYKMQQRRKGFCGEVYDNLIFRRAEE